MMKIQARMKWNENLKVWKQKSLLLSLHRIIYFGIRLLFNPADIVSLLKIGNILSGTLTFKMFYERVITMKNLKV